MDGTVIVDLYPTIYRFTKAPKASAVFNVEPAVPLYDAFKSITDFLSDLIVKHELDLLLCLDNRGHPEDSGDESSEACREYNIEDMFDLDDEDVEPEDVEEFVTRMEDTSECDSKVPSVFLCSFVQDMVTESAKRAELTGGGESHEYKLEQTKIQKCQKCLRDLLEGKGGPEESVDSKLYQLRVHESLHKPFLAEKIPKNLFSFYLMHTRVQRHVHINQLERAKELGLEKNDLNWTAQRLEKCPPGMVTLADRGFADCAVFIHT